MFWLSDRKQSKRVGKAPLISKRLAFEPLESRKVLSVNVNAAGGVLTISGDNGNNNVLIQAGPTPGTSYTISAPAGDPTQFTFNGGGPQASVTVFGITSNMTINSGTGTTTYVLGTTTGTRLSVPGLQINNAGGDHSNTLHNVFVNGNFSVTSGGGPAKLTIDTNSEINGITNVANGAGDNQTIIKDSVFDGNGGAPTLLINNGAGNNSVSIQATAAGTSGVQIGPAAPGTPALQINNNGGRGSVTSLTGLSATAGLGTFTVHGDVMINNGTAVFGEAVNMVTFNAMNVLGATKINNADSDTSTTVLGSTLGSQVVNPLGGQMVVTNNLGFDSFSMGANTAGQNTTVPWGLYINNDAGAGGSSASGSQTTIAAASIGTLAGGLPGGNGLDPGVAFKVCDDQGSVNTLKVGADPGATGAQATAKAVTFGGGVVVRGSNGGDDDITIGSSTMAALTINTSSGSDTIRIDNSKISNSIAINTGSGEHDHVIISNTNYATQWPNPMLGTITIADGGGGSDELTQTSDVGAIPTAPTGFEVFD